MKQRHGIGAGLIGAGAFIIWFLIVDFAQRQPLRTPAYVSGLLFSFTTALPASARVTLFVVIVFLVFAGVGWLASRLPENRLGYGVVVGVLLAALQYGGGRAVGVDLVHALGVLIVIGCNVIASVVTFSFIKRVRYGLEARAASPLPDSHA